MTDEASGARRECHVFSQYLTGRPPSPYILSKYESIRPYAAAPRPDDRVDTRLLAFALRGPAAARIADAYARIFRPTGTLRRRLTLALAILESSPELHRQFTSGTRANALIASLRLFVSFAAFGCCLLAGIALFGPAQIAGPGRESTSD